MSDRVWFIGAFDDYVAAEGEGGAAVEKSRDALAHQWLNDIDAGLVAPDPVDRLADARAQFDRHIGRTRDRRKTHMRKFASHLLDALREHTILGSADPVLTQAFPLGDGRDKTLGLWSSEDWQTSRAERYRNAAEVATAAADFDVQIAQKFIDALRDRSVRTTGDLFRSGGPPT